MESRYRELASPSTLGPNKCVACDRLRLQPAEQFCARCRGDRSAFQLCAYGIDQPAARIALKLGSEPVAVLPVLQAYGLIRSAGKGHLRFGPRPLLIVQAG